MPADAQRPSQEAVDSVYNLKMDPEELVFRAWAQEPEDRCESGLSFQRLKSVIRVTWSVGWNDGEQDGSPLDWTWVELEFLPIWAFGKGKIDQLSVAKSAMEELLEALEVLYQEEGKGESEYYVPLRRFC